MRVMGTVVVLVSLVSACASPSPQKESTVTVEQVRPDREPVQEEPPPDTVRYDEPTRSSDRWVEAGGARVAVDKGIVGHGVEAYLSLTYDLVVLEEGGEKTLWSSFVGAFWNEITFVSAVDEESREEIALLQLGESGSGTHRHFLPRTGEERFVTAGMASKTRPPDDPGEARAIESTLDGDDSQITESEALRILSGDDWKDLWTRHGGEEGDLPEVDFDERMIVAIFLGKSWNCRGIRAEAFESDGEMVIRYRRRSYQTIGGGNEVTPFGFLEMPRFGGKVILQLNVQRYIGGPPVWRTMHELDPVG